MKKNWISLLLGNGKMGSFGSVVFFCFGVSVLDAQFSFSNNPTALPAGTKVTLVDPSAPVLEAMGPVITYEFSRFRYEVNIINDVEASVSVENLPVGAFFRREVRGNRVVRNVEWTPDWNDAGLYEITFVASNEFGESRQTLQLYVFNYRSPHVSINYVHMKSVRRGNVVRYYMLPMIESDGEIDFTQIEMRVEKDDGSRGERVYEGSFNWVDRNEVINWEDIRQVNNAYWGFNHAYVFDVPYSSVRSGIPFVLSIDALTEGGDRWTQEIEFFVGVGEVACDFYGNNSSAFIFKHKYRPDFSIFGYSAGYDNPIQGNRWGLSGEMVAVGDFDGDQYEDLVFKDGSKISYAISELDYGGGDFYVTHIEKKRDVMGAGDFNGDGVDQLVVVNRKSHEIEKWPYDASSIERGWWIPG